MRSACLQRWRYPMTSRAALSMGQHHHGLRFVHWSTAALVLAQFALAGLNAFLYEPRPLLAEALVQAHLSSGFIVFLLTLVRIVLRCTYRRTAPVRLGWPKLAATVRATIYVCLLVLPAAGYIRLAALGFQIDVIGVLTLPTLPIDPALAIRAAIVHMLAAAALSVAVIVHVAGVFSHRLLTGEPVLHRMSFEFRLACTPLKCSRSGSLHHR